jgi:SPP1 family predicted phage head-tail adaptor
MNFGRQDRQLVLQRPTSGAQDEFGAPAPAGWVDVAKVWGWQKPGTGTEATQAEQLTAQQVVTWQLRYRRDVNETWQFTCEGKLYQITAIAEIGRRVGLLLTTICRGPVPQPIPPLPLTTTAYNTATYATFSYA